MSAAYIYGLTDPETAEVRYIGKANDPEKRLAGHKREIGRRRTPLYSWMGALAKRGLSPGLVVLEHAVDWREAERRLISAARDRGDRLLNLADGGDEPFCSPAVRSANGVKLVERIRSDDKFRELWNFKRSISALLRDNLVSNKTRAKIRYAARALPDVFGQWADIPDRLETETGYPLYGYGYVKGGRVGAPQQI